MNRILDLELGVLKTDVFSKMYLPLTEIMAIGGKEVNSRNGMTTEILNFKTIITDPIKRCVGGYRRDINIFFLLAEAMWIFAGKKDVATLSVFNGRMKDYSDDGINFHAPYGFRLRKWGLHSESKLGTYIDQIERALVLLDKDKEDRRVVLSIWNPDLDLSTVSKDICCNDMLMFKIRDNKLHLTIQNRSNDLHWGLPTNVFQFSFILEIMASILNLEVGTQVHNSQSLHYYHSNPLTDCLLKNKHLNNELYNTGAKVLPMDFHFTSNDVVQRLKEVTCLFEAVLAHITTWSYPLVDNFSSYFMYVKELLTTYSEYANTKRLFLDKNKSFNEIVDIGEKYACKNTDIQILAENFFGIRMGLIEAL